MTDEERDRDKLKKLLNPKWHHEYFSADQMEEIEKCIVHDEDMSDETWEDLIEYTMDDMPYGTRKARTGDPYDWLSDHLTDYFDF